MNVRSCVHKEHNLSHVHRVLPSTVIDQPHGLSLFFKQRRSCLASLVLYLCRYEARIDACWKKEAESTRNKEFEDHSLSLGPARPEILRLLGPPYLTTSSLIYSDSIDFFQEAKLLTIPSKFMSENHCLAYCDMSKWPVGMVTEIAFPGFLLNECSCAGWWIRPDNESYWQKRRKKQARLLRVSLVTSPRFLLLPMLLFSTPLLFTLLFLFDP